MPERLSTQQRGGDCYTPPVVEDYGDLVAVTSSHHIAAFQGVQGAVGLLSFSGSAPASGGGPAGFHAGGDPGSTPGHAVEGFAGSSDPSGGGSPAGGGNPAGGSSPSGPGDPGAGLAGHSSGNQGKLPFTGFAVAAEGIVGLVTVSVGLAFRRFTRRRDAAAHDGAPQP